ncbi:MAG: YebC/PmpR family DNA-binding transcriptional regulator [Candidatus Kerfeldbacteria bacterium]
MSGHSKWATIKRKKAVSDAKKGAVFTKVAKNIVIAAKGGKDPDMNPALRTAIDQAKAANMPKDSIEKAILKGAGEVPGAVYEEVVYEAYGPGGIAMIIEGVTDNTNRTVSSVRSTLTKNGGTLGSSGSVMYMFERKGVVRIASEQIAGKDKDAIELAAIDAGAEDIRSEEEGMTILCAREELNGLVDMLDKESLTLASSGLEWITKNMIVPPKEDAEKCEQLIETLEEDDDVSGVYTNADL